MRGGGLQAAQAGEEEGRRPRLRRSQIVDLCAGLFGVQVVWGLQNVNTTRIFQTLGADMAALPLLWIAAPVTGLLVQPIVGHWSDRAGERWGRRKPFIVVGSALTALAMVGMSIAATLAEAVVALWLLTAAVNVAMQPFRSLTADRLPAEQRTAGFAAQVVFIGAGAVFASSLPWMLTNWAGVAGVAAPGALPPSIRLAFQLGAAMLLLSVAWTVLRVREAPVAAASPVEVAGGSADLAANPWSGLRWVGVGGALAAATVTFHLRGEVALIAALAAVYGAARWAGERRARRGQTLSGALEIVDGVARMPGALRRLAITQGLTWLSLFALWIYAVPAVAYRFHGAAAPGSAAYAQSADWVGVLFAIHDGVAAVSALALPAVAARVGLRAAHAGALLAGSAGLAGFLLVADARLLWLPAIGIGVAWASILSVPYVVVTNAAPAARVGLYLGVHNVFVVVPQLIGAAGLGALLDGPLGGRPDLMLAAAAVTMVLAAVSCALLPRMQSFA